MKKILFSAAFLIFMGHNMTAKEMDNKSSESQKVQMITTSDSKLSQEDFDVLMSRLVEIRSMKFSAMNHQDKKELRTEVKAIHNRIKDGGVYFYLSGTAILIIILLLILL